MRIILTILFFLALKANATVYYVKSTGGTGSGLDDANAWSYAKYNSTTVGSGNTVLFKRNDVFYGAMTFYDGVTYFAYGSGADPKISGLTTVTGWTNVGTNLWEASVSAGSVLNVLLIGGILTEPGRFPNTGWLTIGTGGGSSFTTATSSPSTYAGGKVVIKKREWVIDKCAITSISGSTINFSNPTPFPALDNWGFFFTDHPSTLDQQNEWYYSSGTLRLYSTFNPTALTIKAATVDVLATIAGKSNVSISNIAFEGCNGNGLYVSSGSNNSLNNCTVQYTGNNGIAAEFQFNLTVTGCSINNTCWSGIDALFGTYQKVTNNTLSDIALKTSLCQPNNKANHGIWVNGTYNRIQGNSVGFTGYVGIDMSGDYDTCRRNYVYNFNQTSTDGGGIYMSDETNGVGRVIDSNVVVYGLGPRDGTPFSGYDNAMGIYLDESTSGVTISNNFSAYNNGGGLYLHKAHDCIIDNNTFYGNTLRQILAAEDGPSDTKIRNIQFTNNVMHSLSSSDYIYVLFGVGAVDTFFSRMAYNVLSRPASSSNIIHSIIDYYAGGDFTYSLSGWQTAYPNYDVLSTGTPSAFSTGTPITQTSTDLKTFVTLDGVYQDIRGTTYNSGTAVLQPYSGAVLNRVSDFVPVKVVPKVLRGRFR